MHLDSGRVRAVVRKELRDYRRRRAIVVGMLVLPLLFLVEPVVTLFVSLKAQSASNLDQYVVLPLLYLLLIPVIMPSTLAAYTVAGEREQGTLEPLLTTPVRRQEIIAGKAVAILIPTVALAYAVYGLFLAAVALFAPATVAAAVFRQGPTLLALFLFTPLLAGWAIVVGLAVSVRANEVRVAQQIGAVASFPIIGVVGLLAFNVIHPTFTTAALFGVGFLAADTRALRIVSRMFDRERLVTGTKAARSRLMGGSLPLGD
jgi:ABC-2 type transport system permease protein